MSLISFQKMMCYDAWTQRASSINRGIATYYLSVRLTKTRTLRFRYTRMIGLLIVTLDVDVTTSQKRFLNFGLGRNYRVIKLLQFGPKRRLL